MEERFSDSGTIRAEDSTMVTPSVTMEVFFGTECVTNGSNIKPSIAVNPPGITISGQHSELFTLVMTDPDAPNPSEPSMREWVHWIVTDIPGGKDLTQGNEVVSYGPLCPAIGIHRVVALLVKQQRPLGLLERLPSRARHSTPAFASAYKLGAVN
ncbi:protein MOTHER of FT and TFL1-like isoform X2 [Diospyros lotus]|uniref:protein MOTHER of FT and TFL1-like isoform X2 n=1 Tax=Diospyros lotus TaxID=55363 RepID=UPI00224F5290|nr:protein MOTHER of FT and TFL1-like isoform X2 [Diospyros lotus]